MSGMPTRTVTVSQYRQDGTNPLNPRCPLQLRRICGVCSHFEGKIIRTDARCGKLGGIRSGKSSAQECAFWARKSGAAG